MTDFTKVDAEFDETFSNVGWIPEHKERIKDFWHTQLEEVVNNTIEQVNQIIFWDCGLTIEQGRKIMHKIRNAITKK